MRDTLDRRDDPSAWKRDVARLRAELEAATDRTDRLSAMGRLGDLLRVSDATRTEAIELLERALDAAADNRLAANAIRLATALQYAERHAEAAARFRSTLAFIRRHPDRPLLDYVLQHFGKCLVEVGELDRAAGMFEEALQLRRQRGDEGLIASTREAIEALERIRTESGSGG